MISEDGVGVTAGGSITVAEGDGDKAGVNVGAGVTVGGSGRGAVIASGEGEAAGVPPTQALISQANTIQRNRLISGLPEEVLSSASMLPAGLSVC